MLPFELTKDTPYLALSGELWSVFYEYFNRNWSCYKGFLLYIPTTLTHCGLGDFNEILDEYFLSQLKWLMAEIPPGIARRRISPDITDDKPTLVQAITWANVDPFFCRHMVSLGPIELTTIVVTGFSNIIIIFGVCWMLCNFYFRKSCFVPQFHPKYVYCHEYQLQLNSLGPSDAIWHWRSWSTLAQVMACCLTEPSHYLNQCWLIISKVLWHSSEDIIIRRFEDSNQ